MAAPWLFVCFRHHPISAMTTNHTDRGHNHGITDVITASLTADVITASLTAVTITASLTADVITASLTADVITASLTADVAAYE